MNLDIDVDEIDASGKRDGIIEVSLRGCQTRQILDHFEIQEVIQHFGEDELLNAIGERECCIHFNLVENPE